MKLPTLHGLTEALRGKLAQARQTWAAMPVSERFVTVCLSIMIVGGS